MPSRNRTKTYVKNGYYHLYNRGVDKRIIFQDQSDCTVFLRLLKQYLSPKEELKNFLGFNTRLDRLMRTNMYGEIDLLSFALMPNHFHLLVKQTEINGITKFMTRLCTSYAMYFNKKYGRTGHLFQDKYKGVLVLDDNYILHLSRYIHLNPSKIPNDKINFYEFTSYPYYLGLKKASWIKSDFILEYFSNKKIGNYDSSYKKFIEDYREGFSSEEILKDLALDAEEE